MPIENLFGRLFRYRPSANRSPEEDFFTEAFAGTLERHPDVAKSVFKFLTQQQIDNVSINTQVPYLCSQNGGSNRIDLQLIGQHQDNQRHILFVESKLSSGEGDEQLSRYSHTLAELSGYKSKMLCYLTKRSEPKVLEHDDGINFVQFRWSDVHKHLRSNFERVTLVRELLDFMEDLSMTREVQLGELRAGVKHYRSHTRIWNLLEDAWIGFEKRDQFTSGKRSSFLENSICIWSPRHKTTGVSITIGIWFDTSTPGELNLKFKDPESPVAYVAIWHHADGSAIYTKYKSYFKGLAQEGIDWALEPESANCVIKRTLPINVDGSSDVTQRIDEFFTDTLAKIASAPFLQ